MNCRIISTLLLLIFIDAFTSYSQHISTFSGKVIDATTKAPLPYLTIFFANTMMGTTSSESGDFMIANIPDGKYDLTVSGVGYKLITRPIEIHGQDIRLIITVEPDVKLLGEVMVKSRPSDFNKQLRTFTRYFLGTSNNASQCDIVNVEAIDFDYDSKNKVLTATAQEPIEIINHALGYKIHYLLQTFKLDNKNGLVISSGFPRFENLTPDKKKQEQRWLKKRDQAFFGSPIHFIRCLYNRSLTLNNYGLYEVKNGNEKIIDPASLFFQGSDSIIDFHGTLKVVYANEMEEVNYSRQSRISRPQTSYLQFGEKNIRIYKNGYFEDQLNIVFSGYMGWEKIAELVPAEYEPSAQVR